MRILNRIGYRNRDPCLKMCSDANKREYRVDAREKLRMSQVESVPMLGVDNPPLNVRIGIVAGLISNQTSQRDRLSCCRRRVDTNKINQALLDFAGKMMVKIS
jgi:hypothetical protein